MRSRVASSVLAIVTVGLLSSAWPSAYADPPGTVRLVDDTVPSVIRLLDGTEAGLLYATDSQIGGHRQVWLRPTGTEPVPLAWSPTRMKGRMLFSAGASEVTYSVMAGPTRTCAVPPGSERLVLTPTGWAYVEPATGKVQLVTATDSGCSTRSLLTVAHPYDDRVRVSEGDAHGHVLRAWDTPATQLRLSYLKYADPAHPIDLDHVGDVDHMAAPEAGGILVTISNGGARARLIPLDGGPAVELWMNISYYWPPRGFRTTRTHVGAGGPFRTIPRGGGPLVDSGIGETIASDGVSFYTESAAGQPAGIYRRADAGDPGTLLVAPPATRYPVRVSSIALSPGAAYVISHGSGTTMTVWLRTMTRNAGSITLGTPRPLAGDLRSLGLAASAGRLVFDGRTRTYNGAIKPLPQHAWSAREMSGNRALVHSVIGSYPNDWRWPDMFDARTGRMAGRTWPAGPQDIFGNHFLHARADGSVIRRDLATGRDWLLRPAGSQIQSVAIHGRWTAWLTACPQVHVPCLQTITLRDLLTGKITTLGTRGTLDLDLSGGFLAFDAIPNAPSTRQLRVLRLGTAGITSVGSLPERYTQGVYGGYNFTRPRHFDLDDETVGWIDRESVGKAAPLPSFVDPPVYLGNAIVPASFSPNGDGTADTWAASFPISKALPTCTLTIYRATTAVRVLGCANTTGTASVVWNGRTATGAALPPGRYTYRLNGRDSDGWIRHWDLRPVPITGVLTKTT